MGNFALQSNTTGSHNFVLGNYAGSNLTTGDSNLVIGNLGVAGDSFTIRIGAGHTRAFIGGVRGATTGVSDGLQVLINSDGQLGTISSSAGGKRDIAGMGAQSAPLMKLRPVSFFYRTVDVGFRQYGLIAEEVAEVMPELVQFSPDGKAETVRYHFLAPMLLNELQKQQQTIEQQRLTIEDQQKQLAELRNKNDEQIRMIEARLVAVEGQSRDRSRLAQSTGLQETAVRP